MFCFWNYGNPINKDDNSFRLESDRNGIALPDNDNADRDVGVHIGRERLPR
jgi:hypothetical protein